MATIKSFTSLEQSKKLAEILPLESADMVYQEYETVIGDDYVHAYRVRPFFNFDIDGVPCWSLAVLLDYLSANFRVDIKYLDNYWELDCRVHVEHAKELLDACVEMIIRLNELKIL